jgi:hypothetical protein
MNVEASSFKTYSHVLAQIASERFGDKRVEYDAERGIQVKDTRKRQ